MNKYMCTQSITANFISQEINIKPPSSSVSSKAKKIPFSLKAQFSNDYRNHIFGTTTSRITTTTTDKAYIWAQRFSAGRKFSFELFMRPWSSGLALILPFEETNAVLFLQG